MKQPNNSALRIVAGEFYRKNMPFFLLFGLLIFGIAKPSCVFLSPPFVFAVLASPKWMIIVLSGIAGYLLKCLFNLYQIAVLPENRVLQLLPALGKRQFRKIMMELTGALMAPGLLYLGLMTVFALWKLNWVFVFPLSLGVAAWLFAGWMFSRLLLRPRDDSHASGWAFFFNRKWLGFMPRTYLSLLMNEHARGVWVVKAVTLCSIGGVFWYSATESIAVQLTNLLFLGIACLHSSLILRLRIIEDEKLKWFRGLPRRLGLRFMDYMIFIFLLMLPELVLGGALSIRFGLPADMWIHLAGFQLSTLSLFLSMSYMTPPDLKRFPKWVFWVFVGFFFPIMFKLNFWWVWPFVLAFATTVVMTGYWEYEG